MKVTVSMFVQPVTTQQIADHCGLSRSEAFIQIQKLFESRTIDRFGYTLADGSMVFTGGEILRPDHSVDAVWFGGSDDDYIDLMMALPWDERCHNETDC